MELYYWVWVSAATLATCYVCVDKFVRSLNGWYYDLKLRKKPLPPGDMGWPLIGNLISFYKAFSSGGNPDSFINNFHLKYGQSGIYKTHLFGNPSIIVCEPEMIRKMLTDDENFKPGYPKSTVELIGSTYNSHAEHRRFRRLINPPIMDHKALPTYLEHIEDIVTNSLEELSSMKHPVELLEEMKKVAFKTIIHILMGSSIHQLAITEEIASFFDDCANGVLSLPINAPGFAFHKGLKARKKLIQIVQTVLDERRLKSKNGEEGKHQDFLDSLLEVNDENGQKLEDEYIIGLLISLLFAGHETTGTALMWTIVYLTQHPHILIKAKEEQEEIMKTRVSSQNRLSLKEIKQMVYLSQVIDETLRYTNMTFSTFREATSDVNINGYVIPKGWKVLLWARAIHMDPKYYPNPEEFNPSRWDDYNGKSRTFLPFGGGTRLCPGKDLAKLEIYVFVHYFLLNYKLERINPECPITFLPIRKPVDNCLAKVIKVSCN